MTREKHVIIGNGPSGITAAETIRASKLDDEILIVTEEPHLSYRRILLPDYVAGRVALERLWLKPESYYKDARIELRLGTEVVSVAPENHNVVTATGESISFDRLLIACGGKPKLPPIAGIDTAPVLTLKTLGDAQKIISTVRRGASILVLARDLIGVEITRAFSQMGLRVTYVEWGDDQLLPHILDPATAQELAEKMKNWGVRLVMGEAVQAVEAGDKSVTLHLDSRRLQADLLAAAIGNMPSLEWLRAGGIKTDVGIIADERLRTNFSDIYVAGDAAEIYDPRAKKRKLLFGWKNAVEQGTIAGANMAGDMRNFEVTYVPGVKQIFGVDVRHRWK
jgi:nitrite reductase (NADH) large subunit